MAFEGKTVTIAYLIKIELPNHTIRLSDGGAVYFEGELYEADDPVYGSVAGADNHAEGIGEEAPGGSIMFYPKDAPGATVLVSDDMQNSRVRAWMCEVNPDAGIVTDAFPLTRGLVDVPTLRTPRGQRLVEKTIVSEAERLFLFNQGNGLTHGFHISVHPGELGLQNATGVETDVPWGTKSRPRGSVSGGGGGGSPNFDFRNFQLR